MFNNLRRCTHTETNNTLKGVSVLSLIGRTYICRSFHGERNGKREEISWW